MQVLLWHYPDSNLAPVVLRTPHLANIFGVRFLSCSGNRRIVTGAMDCSVQLHVLDASPYPYARAKREQRTVRWVPDESNESVPLHTTKYLCHSKRVKVRTTEGTQACLVGLPNAASGRAESAWCHNMQICETAVLG